MPNTSLQTCKIDSDVTDLAVEAASIIPLLMCRETDLSERLFSLERQAASLPAGTSTGAAFQLGIIGTQVDAVLANVPEDSPAYVSCREAAFDVQRMLSSICAFISDGRIEQKILAQYYLSSDFEEMMPMEDQKPRLTRIRAS